MASVILVRLRVVLHQEVIVVPTVGVFVDVGGSEILHECVEVHVEESIVLLADVFHLASDVWSPSVIVI
jgi:hypothetical protein